MTEAISARINFQICTPAIKNIEIPIKIRITPVPKSGWDNITMVGRITKIIGTKRNIVFFTWSIDRP